MTTVLQATKWTRNGIQNLGLGRDDWFDSGVGQLIRLVEIALASAEGPGSTLKPGFKQ